MRKLTRDEERFKSCLKKSKSKVLHQRWGAACLFYYFEDVNQTGWSHVTIDDLIREDIVYLSFVSDRQYKAKWNSTNS